MCIIAGYSGNKRAAPIIIEMLKKTEYFDGGLSTGIATIHEGKLYTAKVIGDVDTLLRETDAINFPGTTGIIHSRTGGNLVSHAHPFTSEDGELALVLNGTTRGGGSDEYYAAKNKIMNDFLDRGFEIKSAFVPPKDLPKPVKRVLKNGLSYHDTEPYALMIGDAVSNSPAETIKRDIAKATRDTLSTLPIDIITLCVHARLPDTITIGTITRPMSIGFGDGETYLATCAIAFPEEIQKRPVMFLPPTTTAQVTPNGLEVFSTTLDGVRVEQPNYRIAKRIRSDMEKILAGGRENPVSIYDFPASTDWLDVWHEPLVDSKYVREGSFLKPTGPISYEGLWSFHKEGRLHSVLGEKADNPGVKITKFWIE